MELSIKDANVTPTPDATPSAGGCGCGGCGCGGGGNQADAGAAASASGATVARYTVTGMTCGHCVAAVTEEVSALPGVTDVAVDLATGDLRVTSSSPVDFDRIVEAVAEAGDYSVA